jgi:hypothetical protein
MAEDTKPTAESKTDVPKETVAIPPKKKSNKTLFIVLGVILVVFVVIPGILLTVGGLFLRDRLSNENVTESLIEGATGNKVDVNTKDGNFSVKSENGDSSVSYGADQKLPEDFPKDKIPYLEEKSVGFVLTSDNESGHSWSVTTTVDKSYNEAVAYFEERIKSPEFTDTSNFGFGESKTFYGKKDTYTVSVSISKSEQGDTTVSYIVNDETVHTH